MTWEDEFCSTFEPTTSKETESFTIPLDLAEFISTYVFMCCAEKAP